MAFGAFAPLPIRLGGSPEEGWTAEQFARLSADLQALKRVAPLATWRYSQTGGAAVTMVSYAGQNGVGLAYAPTATPGGDGVCSFTWDAQYFQDEYGNQYPFKIRAAYPRALGSNSAIWEQIALGIRIRIVSAAGVAGNTQVCISVW